MNGCVHLCAYTASVLDSAVLSVAACMSLAEIGRRSALPLQRESPSSSTDQLTTDQCVELTTAGVIEKLVNKVKSTSENAKVSHMAQNLGHTAPFIMFHVPCQLTVAAHCKHS